MAVSLRRARQHDLVGTLALMMPLLLSLVPLNCAGPSKSGKCEEEDRQQQLDLMKGQHMELQIRWASNKLNLSLELVESLAQSRLDAALEGREVSKTITSNYSTLFGDWYTYTTHFELTSEKKPTQVGQLSGELLRSLDEIADCSQGCSLVTGSRFFVEPKQRFSAQRSSIFVFEPIIVSLEFNLSESLETNRMEDDCLICNQIQTLRNGPELNAKDLIRTVQNFLSTIFNLLDPNKWLALFVAIWLTACLIIAMLIQKRDKRRLRLYLEERTDYSFSTSRRN